MIVCEKLRHDSTIEAATMLIKAGADLNLLNHTGRTALMLTCVYCIYSIELIKELIDAGTNLNVIDNNEDTFFTLYLERNCKCDMAIIKKIIEKDYITFTNKKNFEKLIKTNNELIIEKLFNVYKNNEELMLQILPKLKYKERNDYYRFRINMNEINNKIIKQRNFLYEKPNNIISLCCEVGFLRKQNNCKIPDKLKFLFDIKSENDCLNKIKFYS